MRREMNLGHLVWKQKFLFMYVFLISVLGANTLVLLSLLGDLTPFCNFPLCP